MCQTTTRGTKLYASNIAKQQTPTSANKLKSYSHKTFYKNVLYIFVALNYIYAAERAFCKKRLQKLNWQRFVKEVYCEEIARHMDSQRTLPALRHCDKCKSLFV